LEEQRDVVQRERVPDVAVTPTVMVNVSKAGLVLWVVNAKFQYERIRRWSHADHVGLSLVPANFEKIAESPPKCSNRCGAVDRVGDRVDAWLAEVGSRQCEAEGRIGPCAAIDGAAVTGAISIVVSRARWKWLRVRRCRTAAGDSVIGAGREAEGLVSVGECGTAGCVELEGLRRSRRGHGECQQDRHCACPQACTHALFAEPPVEGLWNIP